MTHFQKCFVLNLDRRPERWTAFKKAVKAMDWPFPEPERWSAVDGKKVGHPSWFRQGAGAWGCFRSHVNIMEHCMNNGIESYIVFEDDAIFQPEFSAKAQRFLGNVPSDWDVIYLGGQHLNRSEPRLRPVKAGQHVVRGYDINRTHCFGMRTRAMREAYIHLHDFADWMENTRHHIDHRLGVLYCKSDLKVYCPDEWLVGQASGYSDICSRECKERFWVQETKPLNQNWNKKPFVPVVGLHRSGSSCLAGVLHRLGVYMGTHFIGPNKSNPGGAYEAKALAKMCEQHWPFPATATDQDSNKLTNELLDWIQRNKQHAAKNKTIAGGKYPHSCRMFDNFKHCGPMRPIFSDRPLEDSIRSLEKRNPNIGGKAREVQEWLWEGRKDWLQEFPQALHIEYDKMVENPRREIDRIIEYLEIRPDQARIDEAVAWVNPDWKHH